MLFSFQVGGDDDRIRKRTTQGIYTRVACFGSNSEVVAVASQICSTPNNRHSPLERTRPFGARSRRQPKSSPRLATATGWVLCRRLRTVKFASRPDEPLPAHPLVFD
jgi:hypothetical protein